MPGLPGPSGVGGAGGGGFGSLGRSPGGPFAAACGCWAGPSESRGVSAWSRDVFCGGCMVRAMPVGLRGASTREGGGERFRAHLSGSPDLAWRSMDWGGRWWSVSTWGPDSVTKTSRTAIGLECRSHSCSRILRLRVRIPRCPPPTRCPGIAVTAHLGVRLHNIGFPAQLGLGPPDVAEGMAGRVLLYAKVIRGGGGGG